MRIEPVPENTKKTLLITCSCCPVVVEDLLPNDKVYVISNLANIVPPFLESASTETAASIEYALTIYGTRRIIVCGHSPCAVLKDVFSEPKVSTAAVAKWLAHACHFSTSRESERDPDYKRKLVAANVVLQMEHLQTYPAISQKLDTGELALSGWLLLEDEGFVAEYNAEKKMFLLLTQKLPPKTFTRAN